MKNFEEHFEPIFQKNIVGCLQTLVDILAEPSIFTLKELEETYLILGEAYEEYMRGYDHSPAFPIGGLGDRSIVFMDLDSDNVQGFNCDYADLENIADVFPSLMLPYGTGIGTGGTVQEMVR